MIVGKSPGLRKTVGVSVMLFIAGSAVAQNIQLNDQARTGVYVRVDTGKPGDPEATTRLNKIIEEFGSNDFKARAAADKALNDDNAITLPMLERALKERGAQMSIDTRLRITSAARVRFAQTPRAAMGIQFWRNSNLNTRVVIDRTIPDFDAAKKIEDGDMIIEVGGVRVVGPRAEERFQSVIVSHDPGDLVPVVIRRGEARVETEVRMGRRDQLGNTAWLTPEMIERAWKVRSASYVSAPGAGAEVIAPPIKLSEWSVAQPGQMRLDRAMARGKAGAGMGPMVVGGGMPRGATMNDEQVSQRLTAGNLRRNNGAGQVFINMNGVVFMQGGNIAMAGAFDQGNDIAIPSKTLQQELDDLTSARSRASGPLDKARQGQVKQQLPDGQMVSLKDYVQKETKLLDLQIAAIRAEMAEQGITPREPGSAAAGQDPDKPVPTTP